MKKCGVLSVLTILFLFHTQPGFTRTSDEIKAIKEDIKTIKEGQMKIQKDLQEIKDLVTKKRSQDRPERKQAQAQAEFKEALINIDGDPYKGDKNAKLAIIEFSDYQ